MSEHHEGGCHCGAVTFTIGGAIRDVTVCHCSICRNLHGGAAAYSQCRAADLAIAGEALRWYASGVGSEYGFCPECGSSLFWRRNDGMVSFSAGALRGEHGIRTTHHIWVGSAGSYEDLSTARPQHETDSASALVARDG